MVAARLSYWVLRPSDDRDDVVQLQASLAVVGPRLPWKEATLKVPPEFLLGAADEGPRLRRIPLLHPSAHEAVEPLANPLGIGEYGIVSAPRCSADVVRLSVQSLEAAVDRSRDLDICRAPLYDLCLRALGALPVPSVKESAGLSAYRT